MTTIVCVKVGTKYGPEYVNRLAKMVARHVSRPHRFLCLTDEASGLECDYADIGTNLSGWWAKLILFKPHRELEGQRTIYLDLDTVIVGNVDFLFDYTGPFAILRDFYSSSRFGSAIMSIAPGFGKHIWENFTPDVMNRIYGDQNWIMDQVVIGFWQDLFPGKIGSYKADELQASPKDFAICCFHGNPRPHEAISPVVLKGQTGWVDEHWRNI